MPYYTLVVYSSKDFNKKQVKTPKDDMRVRAFKTLQQAEDSIASIQCFKKQIVNNAIEMRKEILKLQQIINTLNNIEQ